MKKIILPLLIVVSFVSCKKEAKTSDSTEAIDVTIAANTKFSYDLGAIPVQDLELSQPQHAQLSKVTTSNSSALYQYVPDSNYVGSDQVTIVLKPHNPAAKGGCHKNGPPPSNNNSCKKNNNSCNHDSQTTYVFNITVLGEVKPDK